jgi:calcineurin-like phosphoesterase family protein
MGRVFLIADTHFFSDKILRYENRPFASIVEMNSYMVKIWNEVVQKDDTVFVLGDFSDGEEKENKTLLSQLKGEKILVMGNHDQHLTPFQWLSQGFDEVSRWPILYDRFFLFSHEPLYISSNMPYANIFGHVHGNPTYKDYSSQSYCVSAERTEYAPILFEKVKNSMKLNS